MAEPDELQKLRDEIDELRQVVNETSRATNYLSFYLAEQSRLMAEHWYRFILWVRPFQLAAYKKPAQIRRLYHRDPAPVLPPSKEDWERPAKVFLPNVAWTQTKK